MAIGKQKASERVGSEPMVRLPAQRFSSSKNLIAGQRWPNLGEPKGLRQRMIAKWNREIRTLRDQVDVSIPGQSGGARMAQSCQSGAVEPGMGVDRRSGVRVCNHSHRLPVGSATTALGNNAERT